MIDIEKAIVRVTWRFPFPREKVFAAIAAGRLHSVVGGLEHLNGFDFRVGGHFVSHWKQDGCVRGEFLEIVPGERVRFTWLESMGSAPSEVTLTHSTKGNFTWVEIVHEKDPSPERLHGFHVGWTECLALLSDEIDGTTLRLTRTIAASAQRVYEAIGRGVLFAHNAADLSLGTLEFREGGTFDFPIAPGGGDYVKGRFLALKPHVRVGFTWESGGRAPTGETEVSLYLRALGPESTRLHLVHDGFVDAEASRLHRLGWEEDLGSFARSFDETLST